VLLLGEVELVERVVGGWKEWLLGWVVLVDVRVWCLWEVVCRLGLDVLDCRRVYLGWLLVHGLLWLFILLKLDVWFG
jgi:hypothetical protein